MGRLVTSVRENMKKTVLIVFMLLVLCVGLFAFDSISVFTDLLKDNEKTVLLRGDYLEARSNYKQDVGRLAVPESKGAMIVNKNVLVPHSFSVGVAQFVPYPSDFESLSDSEKMLNVYNKMLQLSTLKGIKYISFRAGDKPKILFTNAYFIESPKKFDALEDPYVDVLPENKSYYVVLDDTKFGANIYVVNYDVADDEICIEVSNYKNLRFLGAKCVNAGDLHMYVDVKFMEEGLLIFAFASAYDTDVDVKVLFTTVSLDGAFATRIEALKDWFVGRMAY